jgi:dimethylhistidine N-methyltransferase
MPRSASSTAGADAVSTAEFAATLQYYLAQRPRQLPSRYLYDDLGSALFEAICRLPWYGITRAESRLLAANGAAVLETAGTPSTVVELGSGSGEKLRLLLDASAAQPIDVHLVDVSASALAASARALDPLGHVSVTPHRARYEAGLAAAAARRRGRLLVLFLGSNIGNFDPPGAEALLRGIRASMQRGDSVLLGADLVKPERDLLRAYDDPLGVTAAFNRNLLVRINRELDATFDIDAFAHRAIWNADASRIEMHLVSRRAQHVSIPPAKLELSFERDETIWTESSYKYTAAGIADLVGETGFEVADQWIDTEDAFALTLASAV